MAPRARTPKPKAADETARVLRIFDWLVEELDRRDHALDARDASILISTAERIAARTED